MEIKFKKFWVCCVNNYIVAASYDGKKLKSECVIPSFRKFHFIRDWDDLNCFTKRQGMTNREIVDMFLNSDKDVQVSDTTEAHSGNTADQIPSNTAK